MIQAAYLHIPFCEQICHYCDFNKFFLKGQPVDAYLDAMEKEMVHTLDLNPTSKISTIFVGGGTPTALDEKQLEKLLSIIQAHLMPFQENLEYTFEANPGDLSKEKLKLMHDAGVNRLSFGVQTFDDELLKKIGRSHRREDVFQTLTAARQAGFENISLDLIYSLPGQSLSQFKESLATAFSLDLEHFSGYSLQIEPKTVFYNLMREGKLKLPVEELEAEMYELLMDEMIRHGYHQYEISNFAKNGHESKHNLTYWNNEEYYGFGAGAHSYTGGMRNANAGPLNHYMKAVAEEGLPYIESHQVTMNEKMEEEMFLGLRKAEGVSKQTFLHKFDKSLETVFDEQLSRLEQAGLIEVATDAVRLTRKGKLLGNEVFQAFIGEI